MADRKQQHTRFARACTACYQKKIRCNVASGKMPCSSCELHGSLCIPRPRKRKHGPDPTHGNGPDLGQSETAEIAGPRPTSMQVLNERLMSRVGQQHREQDRSNTSSVLPPAPAHVDYEGYYGASIPTHQHTEDDQPQSQHNSHITETNRTVLQLFNAFEFPTAAWQSSLLENFLTYARPLMPIVSPQWLESKSGYTAPTILVKAILLAGARTTNTRPPFSCDEYYSAVKAMMFYSPERNPITDIIVACVLGWYNQASTYTVTVDSSSAWLRFASNIAYQIGLHKELNGQAHAGYRRRLWWTLIARDCQISAGQGRPRIFNLADCTIKPISTQDFAADDTGAEIFVAHVTLCLILGDLCDLYRRKEMTTQQRDAIRNRLLWWLKTLPCKMQYFKLPSAMKPSSDNLMVRQLFVIYFAVVAILHRTDWSTQVVHPLAIIASSFMVSLLEGFIARDEVQRLPTMFCFYAMSASIPQIVATRFHKLNVNAEDDLSIIQQSLTALSARWPSSDSAFKHFQTLKHSNPCTTGAQISPMAARPDDLLLFEDFDPSTCRSWSLLTEYDGRRGVGDEETPEIYSSLSSDQALPRLGFAQSAPGESVPSVPGANIPWERQDVWENPFDPLDTSSFADFPNLMGSWLVFDD